MQTEAEKLAAMKADTVSEKAIRVIYCYCREKRRSLKLTLEEVGKAVEVSAGNLSTMERGLARPSLVVALRLSRFYGVTVNDLWSESPK